MHEKNGQNMQLYAIISLTMHEYVFNPKQYLQIIIQNLKIEIQVSRKTKTIILYKILCIYNITNQQITFPRKLTC